MLFNEAEPIVDFQLATNVDLMNFTQNSHFARSIQIELTHSVELSTFLEKALELVKTGDHKWDEVSTLKLRLFPRITGSYMELGRRVGMRRTDNVRELVLFKYSQMITKLFPNVKVVLVTGSSNSSATEGFMSSLTDGYALQSTQLHGFVTIHEDYIRIAIVNVVGVCIEMVQRGVWVISVMPGGVVIFNEVFTGFRTCAVLMPSIAKPIANEWASGFEDLLAAAECFGVRLRIEPVDQENYEESE
ncbi:hypothetical protein H4S08_001520 [Coemansia sp. RSA 1365]|nr:hypothetical protein H4S08_001520 [Coemansia sp. RSA 1365]